MYLGFCRMVTLISSTIVIWGQKYRRLPTFGRLIGHNIGARNAAGEITLRLTARYFCTELVSLPSEAGATVNTHSSPNQKKKKKKINKIKSWGNTDASVCQWSTWWVIQGVWNCQQKLGKSWDNRYRLSQSCLPKTLMQLLHSSVSSPSAWNVMYPHCKQTEGFSNSSNYTPGATPLYLACRSQPGIVTLLLAGEADVNAKDKFGATFPTLGSVVSEWTGYIKSHQPCRWHNLNWQIRSGCPMDMWGRVGLLARVSD